MNSSGILFWSGGKDAYLALKQIRNQYSDVHLLVTYDEQSDTVPFQQIPVAHLRRQAGHLRLPLIEVPLPPECPNDLYVDSITQAIDDFTPEETDLIFGDLHIEDIRKWRESVFQPLGFNCRFPVWQMPYDSLFNQLFDGEVSITITSADPSYQNLIKPGSLFTREFINQLPAEIDAMGEHGEFHTRLDFID